MVSNRLEAVRAVISSEVAELLLISAFSVSAFMVCFLQLHVTCKCGRQNSQLTCADVDKRWVKSVAQLNQQIQLQVMPAFTTGLDKRMCGGVGEWVLSFRCPFDCMDGQQFESRWSSTLAGRCYL